MIDTEGIIWELENRKLGKSEFYTDDDIVKYLKDIIAQDEDSKYDFNELETTIRELENELSDAQAEVYDLNDINNELELKISKLEDDLEESKENS